MAKKTKTKKAAPEQPENLLPQNILLMGEHVEEDKNIYLSQAVYRQIHAFTRNKTTNESGGMLLGTVVEEFGKTNIVISGFVEARHCEATPTTLTFTHETWAYVHREMEKKHPGKKIVGWIHTHPDFGIFLSEYDKFIHQNFFSEPYQIAYVVDPIQQSEGFYFWIGDKLERCRGFYLYDKTGAAITAGGGDQPDAPADAPKRRFSFRTALLILLSAAVVLLAFAQISADRRMKTLEQQQLLLADSANQSLSYMQQLILSQAQEIQRLTDAMTDAGLLTGAADDAPADTPDDAPADAPANTPEEGDGAHD